MVQRSFIKWIGGKARSANQIVSYFPKDFKEYFEPFLGSGVIYFNFNPQGAYLSDSEERLIYTFSCVKNELEDLKKELLSLKNTEDDYYKIREEFNNCSIEKSVRQAARFIYLNKCGYNGLFRVNKSNKFNVPYGKTKSDSHLDFDNLTRCSRALASTTLMSVGYDYILDIVLPGDFVYMDPPYLKEDGNSFIGYNVNQFDAKSHKELAERCYELDERGVKFAVSNSNMPVVSDLYYGFNIVEIMTTRSVSRDVSKRGSHAEVLITNY